MASSNIGVMTTGDIEAQQHNPNWLAAHKHMLRSNQESEVNKSRFFIFKVLQHMRQPSKAFFPMGWKFGLYNRENLDSSGLEAIKLDIARHYGLVGEKWDDFCDAIVDDPKAMLACYDLQDKVSGWSDEQIKHILALDALFLATILDIACSPNELQLWRHNTLISQFHANNVLKSKSFTWIMSMRHDLFRVENQIPRVLIDKVVDYIINFIPSLTFEGIELHIDDLQYRQRCVEFGVRLLVGSFMDISSEAFKSAISSAFGVKTHLFGVAYHVICGPNGSSNVDCTRLSTYIHIPLAAKLDQSSIKIVGVDGPLCTMSYENKCLYLPKVTLASQTSFFL